VHLLDFQREIYGRHVRIEFLHKLRDEQRYPDLEELRKQIAIDVENTRKFFRATASENSSARRVS
jgi:riboflavin kinase/FMN adenylyltransferase